MRGREPLGDPAEHRMVLRPLVFRDPTPIDGLRRGIGLAVPLGDFLVAPSGLLPALAHERHATEAVEKGRLELHTRKIAFDPSPLLAVVEHEHGGRPGYIE